MALGTSEVDAGIGIPVTVDHCGAGGDVQVVKLATSAAGVNTPIPADTTYGLDVDVTRLPPVTVSTLPDVNIGTMPPVSVTVNSDLPPFGDTFSGTIYNIVDNVAHELLGWPGEGRRYVITDLLVTNEHADTGTVVEIRDNTLTTLSKGGYAAPNGGGFVLALARPWQLNVESGLEVICGTTGARVHVAVGGYVKEG